MFKANTCLLNFCVISRGKGFFPLEVLVIPDGVLGGYNISTL